MDADSKQLGLKIEIEGQEDPKEDAPSMHQCNMTDKQSWPKTW